MRSEAMTLMEQRGLGAEETARALELPLEEVLRGLGAKARTGVSGLEAAGHELWTLCRHSAGFPDRLTEFQRESDVPHVLFGFGRRELLAPTTASLAIVGARRASAYGREVAYSLANDAAARGIEVVSGMALGIDGAAHRGALQAGGATVAVLAGGPDTPYPRSHRLLYEQILESGCVVSENPPGVEARRWAFVARNRIIAGISSMTVWVEGAESSGARHTFEFADALDLPVGAVPGPVNSPMSAGPNARLGAEGVRTIRGIDDVVEELAIEIAPPRLPGIDRAGSGLAEQLLDHIAAGERTPRELAAALPHRSQREISQALGTLELAGVIVREPSGEYRRLL